MLQQLQNNLAISHDSVAGKIIFKWSQLQFKTIMQITQFQLREKSTNSQIYQKKIKLANQRNCTFAAYTCGSFLINGCNSMQQMKNAVNQFFNEKINVIKDIYIDFAEKIFITHMRSKINYGKVFNLQRLLEYLNNCRKQLSQISLQRVNKTKGNGNLYKIYVPTQIHKNKSLSIYLWKNGILQVYKSHLLDDINKFATKLYADILHKFVVEKQKQGKATKKLNENKQSKIGINQYQFEDQYQPKYKNTSKNAGKEQKNKSHIYVYQPNQYLQEQLANQDQNYISLSSY